MMSTFRGVVCSGRGKAVDRLAPLADQIAQALGGSMPVPGSLNVVLDRPITLDLNRTSLRTDDRRAFWLAKINGVPVLVYRYRRCPLHVVELVSDVPLRQHLDLRDGETVSIDLGEAIRPTSPLARIVWKLFWKGREASYYTEDRDLRIQRRFGFIARIAHQKL